MKPVFFSFASSFVSIIEFVVLLFETTKQNQDFSNVLLSTQSN